MSVQQHILSFITCSNWVLLLVAGILGLMFAPLQFALGIISGGLIVTLNFHLLSRTLKKALTPQNLTSPRVVLAKYYLRFFISGVILFILIFRHYVDPLGLFVGLSVVVTSILMATVLEIKNLLSRRRFKDGTSLSLSG